jgi:hypothetical protein
MILIFAVNTCSFAEDKPQNQSVGPKPGMEFKKVGSVNRLVPEGTQVTDVNGLIIFESIDEFTARRFLETNSRLENIENRLDNFDSRLKDIENCLNDRS